MNPVAALLSAMSDASLQLLAFLNSVNDLTPVQDGQNNTATTKTAKYPNIIQIIVNISSFLYITTRKSVHIHSVMLSKCVHTTECIYYTVHYSGLGQPLTRPRGS